MDYESDNINRRDAMLSRFRESLSRPMSERYFDEDELLEVFDYAGDLGDDYLRTEALLCAARYFPDSQLFQERKAIFYNQISDEAGNKYIDDHIDAEGLMWDIMRARRAAPKDSKAQIDILESLLEYNNEFSDEEVIQFVDLAVKFNQMDWLKENLPSLREKVSFINILLYEVAVAAENANDPALSAKMLEELTELEPFNFYFWMMLARQYEALDQGEKAINAIDYALAINPDDCNSLLTKAKLLYLNSKTPETIIEILKRVLELKPDHTEATRLLASIYSDTGNKIMASLVLSDHISKYPSSIYEIVPDLVLYRPSNIDELLDKFYAIDLDTSQFVWAGWAHNLSQRGYPDVAEKVIKAYERNSGEKVYSFMILENLFKERRFEDTIVTLGEYLSNTDNDVLNFPAIAIMHLLSTVQLGEFDHAESFCEFLLSNAVMGRFNDIGSRLEYLGMVKVVQKVRNRLKRTKNIEDWTNFDPLEIWI